MNTLEKCDASVPEWKTWSWSLWIAAVVSILLSGCVPPSWNIVWQSEMSVGIISVWGKNTHVQLTPYDRKYIKTGWWHPIINKNGRKVLTVWYDVGWHIDFRKEEISKILSEGVQVEITGNMCYSACTLYLGLPHLCIDANTKFWFHGPINMTTGKPLSHNNFEKVTHEVADYFPAPLKTLFLEDWRYKYDGYHVIKWNDLIRSWVAHACNN